MQKPASTFDIKIDGELRTIKMSFALFQDIMKVIPSPEKVADLLIQDFFLREYVARRILSGNKRIKDDEELVDLFDLDLDDDALEDMMLWVTDHILYFFTNTADRSMKLGVRYQEKMKALTPSNP